MATTSVLTSDRPPLEPSRQLETFRYDNSIVRLFLIATTVWGIIGMTVGLIAALQLVYPALSFDLPFLTFGRIRPLHTNAVIFAFVGNGIFAGVYYSLQRLCKARMFSDTLSKINFWGWQLIILSAVLTLPLGIPPVKSTPSWSGPLILPLPCCGWCLAWNMFATILKRRERHLYVAIWFYIATFVTVAVLHIVNSFELPISMFKSYSWYAGVQDALVQWWYGHNAVAFFLTTPYLGLMYYFVPKAANRPDLLVPALHHSLLGADLYLHLGRAAPPALQHAAQLGAVAGGGILYHADCPLVGRNAQRTAHPARRVGPGAGRPGAQVYGGGHHLLRHGHL